MENNKVTAAEYADMIKSETERSKERKPGGNLNFYRCACGWFLITIDTDPGVTPAFLGCDNPRHLIEKSTSALGPMMSSCFYRPPAGFRDVNASHEWFRPPYEDYLKITHAATAEHVAAGGLLFRKIGDTRVEDHDVIFEGVDPLEKIRKQRNGK